MVGAGQSSKVEVAPMGLVAEQCGLSGSFGASQVHMCFVGREMNGVVVVIVVEVAAVVVVAVVLVIMVVIGVEPVAMVVHHFGAASSLKVSLYCCMSGHSHDERRCRARGSGCLTATVCSVV